MNAYYAAIFTSKRTEHDPKGYSSMADKMDELASEQPGFIRVESVRDFEGNGITVSYWESLEAIQKWKENSKHQVAQQKGKDTWYSKYDVQICKVMREYSLKENE
ncbi:antibiotic biosynthesis monooxygenase [Viridibacillus sp. YIM B01967]|uniref:Antibiotic biosynthesis monooxygenase n=1 Tax=Viridibacillus soli TaxID=2798301 RepID=A0ABS1H6F3_9BACL|nr:antibiotic biosynthesis monooxygenase [Viridibacillus soli]MBK3494993.1 antibiotic biosynthesis monooxygenase [Viridibacillus soli]